MLESYWLDFCNPKDPLFSYRKKGWERFEAIGLPKGKEEAFQYVTKKWQFPTIASRKPPLKHPLKGVVFVDGFFEESLSEVSTPIVCLPLEAALRSYALFLQTRYTTLMSRETDPFAALNGAFQGRGIFLYVPPKCKAALHLSQIYTSHELASPRVHLYLGKQAELSVTQSSNAAGSFFSNSAMDLVLERGSKLHFVDEAQGDFSAIRATLKEGSQLKVVLLGKKLRTSFKAELLEENAQAEIFGLSQLHGSMESHIHAFVEHMAPHTRSRQHFKTILKDQSRFSFEGKIYVRPEAQKTEAYQLNNTLLLSEQAEVFAKPNLEIFADDVKASHGATIGQLDEEALFYLRSRGLCVEEARQWLIQGFCREILSHA